MSYGYGYGYGTRRTPRAAVAGPFDALGGLYAALDFGGRRLIGAWTGPTRRLRRGSDSAEQDIYVNAAGAQVLADGTPLLTWAGDTAYLAAVYDQSGGGHSAVQTTAAAQPVAVQAGGCRHPRRPSGRAVPVAIHGAHHRSRLRPRGGQSDGGTGGRQSRYNDRAGVYHEHRDIHASSLRSAIYGDKLQFLRQII